MCIHISHKVSVNKHVLLYCFLGNKQNPSLTKTVYHCALGEEFS